MNRYQELRNRQEQEFNELPLGFAFNLNQFNEMMQEWGLDPQKDLDKICRIPCGGYVQKKDAEFLHRFMEQQEKELKTAIAQDKTGEGFIYEMFLFELDSHEYSYTKDPESALDALGYTVDEVLGDNRLKRGLKKAITEIRERKDK